MEILSVVVGVLMDTAGKVLVAQRPPGTHLAGKWEFPGGKRNPGEPPFEALQRELHEELGIAVQTARPLIRVDHDYPGRRVHLDVWRVAAWQGSPFGAEGQAVQWLEPTGLGELSMPGANGPIIEAVLAHRRPAAP